MAEKKKAAAVKPVKAWAICRSDGSMAVDTKDNEGMANFVAGFAQVIPVLITPIKPKKRKPPRPSRRKLS
jgi:hypothetical protein